MKISLFCFSIFLSRVLSDHPINVEITDDHKCIVNVTRSTIKQFKDSLDDEKKVIFFRIHYNSKEADALTKPIPDDHFANPNEYMWLYNGKEGLPIYMNAPYDFRVRSLFILKLYTSTLTVNMTVSRSCNVSTVSRVHFLRLAFQQLMQIVSPAPLPNKKSSAYICYYINTRRNISESDFKVAQRLGLNRKVIHRYCCEVKNYQRDYNDSIDLCRGEEISTASIANLQTIIGIFLFVFLPLGIGFISRAKLNEHPQGFSLVHSVITSFEGAEEFFPSFQTELDWLSENDPYYSVSMLIRWLFCFEGRSTVSSRIRRSLAVVSCMLIIFADLFLQWMFLEKELKSLLDNNVPLGYRAMMFGYKKSAENTADFLGGPFVWFSAFLILGMIVINIPDRLCETIAHCTLHQKQTFTFLVQDVQMLQRYGSLNVSNSHDYDLLHAILKSSLLTALNPSFWFAVIERWFLRLRRFYAYFNNSELIYRIAVVCFSIPFTFISCFLCVCELLLCIVYYGCPLLQILKAIPHSYTKKYISPYFRRRSFKRQILGSFCFGVSLLVYTFLFLFSLYVFVISFQSLSCYMIYVVIAVVAKPDAIIYIILMTMFAYFLVTITDSISETYLSLQKLSITLAQKVNRQFVYIRLGEHFIYRKLFEIIVQQHHPIRYEIAKALIKFAVGAYILACWLYVFQSISLDVSAYVEIGLMIFAAMIPKLMSVVKGRMEDSGIDLRILGTWKPLPIMETIYVFQQETNSQTPLNPADPIDPADPVESEE